MDETENKNAIYGLFKLLSEWKELPAYQLERRADIFFAYFLPDIINGLPDVFKTNGVTITHDHIIPEFPYKLIENTYRSKKVDYAVICNDKLYLIELKTDNNSLDNGQLEDLEKLKKCDLNNKKGWYRLVELVYSIYKSSNSDSKYENFINRLKAVPDIGYSPDPDNHSKGLSKIKPRSIEIIYILPYEPSGKRKAVQTLRRLIQQDLATKIVFKNIAADVLEKAIKKSTDGSIESDSLLSHAFCEALHRWKIPPKK